MSASARRGPSNGRDGSRANPMAQPCQHHWQLEPPVDDIVRGMCLKCHARYEQPEPPPRWDNQSFPPRPRSTDPVAETNTWG